MTNLFQLAQGLSQGCGKMPFLNFKAEWSQILFELPAASSCQAPVEGAGGQAEEAALNLPLSR